MKVKLGSLYKITSGGTPLKNNKEFYDNGEINWVKTGDLKQQYLFNTQDCITQIGFEKSSAKMYAENTVLVAMYGATIGATSILKIPACTNQACAAFPKIDKVIPEYLYYFMKSKKEQFVKDGVGGAQPNISLSYLKNVDFTLTVVSEQKKIVEKLEKTGRLIDLKIQQLKELDNLIKSRFVEMFGDPIKNDKKWETKKLNEVCPVNRYKGQVESTNGQVWLLNLDMIESNTGKIHNYVLEDESKIASSIIKFDTNCVLYSKLRPYLNKVVIPTRSGYATSEMIAMQTNIVNKYFLSNLLRIKSFVDFANGTSYGAKMPRASVDMIKNFDLIFPPKELQNNFAQFAQQVDKTKLAIQKSIDETQKLFDSLMQEYFG